MNRFLIAVAAMLVSFAAQAQVPQYGANVNLDQAKKLLAGAEAEARKIGVPMAIAILDNAGQMVAFLKMDNTQTASVDVAVDKGRSAAIYRRSTKVFQDGLAAGGVGLRFLSLRGASMVEGGLPIIIDGKILGGIGVSGGSAEQDGVVAKGGTDNLK
jgi:glc operon protein GlcG